MISAQGIREILSNNQLYTEITSDLGLDDELNLDSMSLIWLIDILEKTYGLEIDYRIVDLSHFKTINTLRDFMETLLQETETSIEAN